MMKMVIRNIFLSAEIENLLYIINNHEYRKQLNHVRLKLLMDFEEYIIHVWLVNRLNQIHYNIESELN